MLDKQWNSRGNNDESLYTKKSADLQLFLKQSLNSKTPKIFFQLIDEECTNKHFNFMSASYIK